MDVVLVPGCNARTTVPRPCRFTDSGLILTILNVAAEMCRKGPYENVSDLPFLQVGQQVS